MDGILLIDKARDWTSFDIVAKMRGIVRQKKIGHAGTLDPMATGVLPLLLGKATKLSDILPIEDKQYRARVRLGLVTDTQDITGKIVESHPVSLTLSDIQVVAADFVGKQNQTPPMYSAVKVGGQKLYDLARQGIEVHREAKTIEIYAIAIYDYDAVDNEFSMDVSCSKGTYIRTLSHDMGIRLGCGATLTALRRTISSGYRIEDSINIEEAARLAGEGRLEDHILPLESAFSSLPRLELDETNSKSFRDGIRLPYEQLGVTRVLDQLAVYDQGCFLGLARTEGESGLLIATKIFNRD